MSHKVVPLIGLVLLLTACSNLGSNNTASTSSPTSMATPSLNISGYKVDYSNHDTNKLILVDEIGDKFAVPDSVFKKLHNKNDSTFPQTIESMVMPRDPRSPDSIFISTLQALDSDLQKVRNRIYLYNIKTSQLENIYQEDASRLKRTVGRDGNKLVLLDQGIDDSPGPCWNPWANASNSMMYLDIGNPTKLNTYTVPPSQVAIGKNDEKNCEASTGN